MAVTDLAFIDAAGYHFSDYPAFLAFTQKIYQDIYGPDIYLGSDAQDGQLAAVFAQALFDVASLGASSYNSFSPVTAQGVGLARNVKINGISKREATKSTVDVVIVGVAATTITDGIAKDVLGQQWLIPTTTIPGGGTITVTAEAAEAGAINAAPNTITTIFTPTQGWQTVNNPAAATVGIAVETDAALRLRQAQSTAIAAQTLFDGTIGAVENVVGVTAVAGYENDTNATDGNGLPPHSISVVVEGGVSADIAAAIAIRKTPGTQTYGTTTVNTTDSRGMPLAIHFYRPTVADIYAQVTITPGVGWDSSYADLISEAMSAAIDGQETGRIGNTINYTALFITAYLVGTPAYGTFSIVSIELKKNAGAFAAADIDLLFNEIAVSPAANTTVIT